MCPPPSSGGLTGKAGSSGPRAPLLSGKFDPSGVGSSVHSQVGRESRTRNRALPREDADAGPGPELSGRLGTIPGAGIALSGRLTPLPASESRSPQARKAARPAPRHTDTVYGALELPPAQNSSPLGRESSDGSDDAADVTVWHRRQHHDDDFAASAAASASEVSCRQVLPSRLWPSL